MRMGLDFVKLFPAEVVGGVKMLKASASLRQYEIHAHRRHQRAERGGVPCAAERAVLRRQLDGAG